MAERPDPESPEGAEPQQPETTQNDQGQPEGETSSDPIAAELETIREQMAALKDQALRSQAEAENVRRRAARDVENAHKFALEKFVGDLLPVIDSLEKAVETADSAAESAADDGAAAIAEGVRLSLKLFLDVLSRQGVEQIDPHGEPFDPQRHEAMAMVPNPNMEANSVMDVMQRGYLLNGRLVRAAKVIVSKAPDS
jgi:molecular chaperone GrpE